LHGSNYDKPTFAPRTTGSCRDVGEHVVSVT
jgi:hypothetical protein